jgi:hypothetical protein
VTWLIGDPVDLSVDRDAVDGDESEELEKPDTAALPEVAAPVDAKPDDDARDDELVPESAGSAHATACVVASAIPIPSATANAPTRPMYFAVPIVVPLSMSRRNDGHRVGRVARSESSLACGATSSVVHYCNLARFRRGTTEIPRMADRAARRLRHRLVVVLGELVETTAGK